MVKHIVMWRLKDKTESATKEENKIKMIEMLNGLPQYVEEIIDFEVGGNFNPSDAAYDIVLYSSFESKEALGRYQKHPKHVEVAEFVGKVREDRAVVDYEI